MTLPRLRYDRIIWVLFLVIIGVVLLSAIRGRKNSFADRTEVEVVPLNGEDKLISEANVRQLLLRTFGSDLNGTELGRLEMERMEQEVEKDPFVYNADVYVDQNNILRVKIDQRAPMVRVLDNDGGNYYLDENGIKMPPSANFAAHVIVATGNLPPYSPDFQKKKRSRLKDLFLLTQTILADDFLKHFVQQIHVTNTDDFVLVPLVGDQKIVVGSIRHLEDKIERLKIFYRQGMPYAGWRKYETINLKYSGQVVCRK